jgi:SAM-dependent methyltransferase
MGRNIVKRSKVKQKTEIKIKPSPTPVAPAALLKLDLGCGVNKREGFIGVDVRPFKGVDIVTDLSKPWPWEDNSVEEAHASHIIEHFDSAERIHFVNELWRVLKPGGIAHLIAPHWSSARAYGDLTHKWPPVGEFWIYYLSKSWREAQAPHNDGYTCDFEAVSWPNLHPEIAVKNPEYQRHAVTFFKEAWQDIVIKLTAVGKS